MNTSTLHIPLENDIRQQFTEKAKQLGFDSAQAYLRVMIKAAVDGRRIDLEADDWGEPSPKAAARLNRWAKEAEAASRAGELPVFTNVDDMMRYLDNR